jgi:hypothetical protein
MTAKAALHKYHYLRMNVHYNWLTPFHFCIFSTTYTGSPSILNLVIIKLNPARGSDLKAHVWSNLKLLCHNLQSNSALWSCPQRVSCVIISCLLTSNDTVYVERTIRAMIPKTSSTNDIWNAKFNFFGERIVQLAFHASTKQISDGSTNMK